MDAVLLAAGLGTRLRPHTLHTPKPLLPVQGRPILDWTLGALPPVVDRVVVVVHYLAAQVEEYLKSQTHIADWQTVYQDEPQGTGDAARRCRDAIRSDSFMVLNGDDLFGACDLAKLAACDVGLAVYPVDEPRKFGIVFRKDDGTLGKLVEKPDMDGRQLANIGAYSFPSNVFDLKLEKSPRGEYEITDYVSMLAEQRPVQVVEAGFWMPIGNEETWNRAQKADLQSVIG